MAGLVVGFMRRPVTTGAQAGGSVRGLGGFLRRGFHRVPAGLESLGAGDAGQQSKGQEED